LFLHWFAASLPLWHWPFLAGGLDRAYLLPLSCASLDFLRLVFLWCFVRFPKIVCQSPEYVVPAVSKKRMPGQDK
jgi:hypothetical protein